MNVSSLLVYHDDHLEHSVGDELRRKAWPGGEAKVRGCGVAKYIPEVCTWSSNAYQASLPHPPITSKESVSIGLARFCGPFISSSRHLSASPFSIIPDLEHNFNISELPNYRMYRM